MSPEYNIVISKRIHYASKICHSSVFMSNHPSKLTVKCKLYVAVHGPVSECEVQLLLNASSMMDAYPFEHPSILATCIPFSPLLCVS